MKLSSGKGIHFLESSWKTYIFKVKITEKHIIFGEIPGKLNLRLCLDPVKERPGVVFELYTNIKTVVYAFLPHCFIKRKQAEHHMNSIKLKHRRKTQMLWFCKWIMQKITYVEHKMNCSQPIGINPR